VRKLACRVFLFALCRLRCRLRSSFVHACGTGVGFREVTAGVASSFDSLGENWNYCVSEVDNRRGSQWYLEARTGRGCNVVEIGVPT
jgi:hypothetical protein